MFEKVDIHSLSFNPFDKFGKGWLLISATKNGKTNTMTASWGTLGHLWNKDVAIIFIRPQRYTKEFVDESETFTLSFFDDKHKELSYLGTKSGKDEDKISKVNFHIEMVDGNPTFKEAKEVDGFEKFKGLDIVDLNTTALSLLHKNLDGIFLFVGCPAPVDPTWISPGTGLSFYTFRLRS